MDLKKLIRKIRNPNLSLQERLFRLIMMIGLMGLAVGIIVGIIAKEDIINTVILLIAFAGFASITYFSIRYHRTQIGAVITAVILIYLVLPINFLTTGGIYGGGPIWFLFGIVYVCLVVEKKMKYILLISSYLLFSICYYVAYSYPEIIIQHTTQAAYVDSIMTLVVVSMLTCGMIVFQNALYRTENATVRKQKKEIEELSEAQNRFFSSMSHEIRTPINTIIGLNEMILREDVSDEVAADARSIQGASKMLLTLINDILDMSKLESGKMDIVPVTYDVGAMLSDIVNMIWVRAKEKGLEFHIDVDQSMPSQLIGDEVRIKQILINVLNNAVKYTTEGSVTLSIQCKRMENNQVLTSYSVIDTGIGIKKESIPLLFSAFKRVDEERNRYIEGTGLGLSIVKNLVELMGGDIAVNSVYTKGSTFVITLPQKIVGEEKIGELNLETRHNINEREHYRQSFEAPKASVLIVDDNDTNLMVAQKLLRDTKVKIDAVTSGMECLMKTLQNRYDVIFMDHFMPGMDGIECLHAVRSQTGGLNQSTPVVILTANAGAENQALYRREGFDGYLLKPVSGTQLEEELLRHLPYQLVNRLNATGTAGMVEAPVLAHKKKLPILITTESVCDLPKNLLQKYQIAVIPYRVKTEGGEFLDGIETQTDGVLSYIEERGKQAWSEEPEVKEYEDFFAEQLTRAQYIVHISMAQNVSKGYEHAMEASKIFDNVRVVDSGHLSSGMGLLAMYATRLVNDGMTADAIVKELEHLKKNVSTSFIVDSTEHLARVGRIPSKMDRICRALMLHPVITLKNSSLKVKTLRIGTRSHTWKRYIAATLGNDNDIDKRILFITYAGLTVEELREIEEQVKSKVHFEYVFYQKASPAISVNCGQGSFGLLFMRKY